MNLSNFTACIKAVKSGDIITILASLQAVGYLIIFILMFLEGPIVTLIAAYAASLEIFNIYYIIILSIFGNLIPDILYFLIGRYSRRRYVENLIHKKIASKSQLKKLEKNLKKHMVKTIAMIKITPFIAIPGIILSGFLKCSFKKFFLISLLTNIACTIVLVSLGFYGGILINTMINHFKLGVFMFLIIVALLIGLYYLIKKAYKKIFIKKL